jgi:hypothetical protein
MATGYAALAALVAIAPTLTRSTRRNETFNKSVPVRAVGFASATLEITSLHAHAP